MLTQLTKTLALCLCLFLLSPIRSVGQCLFNNVTNQGGASADIGYDVATDAQGNSYVLGDFNGTATFGPRADGTTVTLTAGSTDAFIARYDPAGRLVWINTLTGSDIESGRDIAVDASGNCYITGSYRSFPSTTFNSTNGVSITAPGDNVPDAFVASYSPAGVVNWVRTARGSGGDAGYGVGLDANANVYVTGIITGSNVAFTSSNNISQTIASTVSSSGDIFVARYSPAGELTLLQSFGGTGTDMGTDIGADAAGNYYLTGRFNSASMTIGTTLSSAGATTCSWPASTVPASTAGPTGAGASTTTTPSARPWPYWATGLHRHGRLCRGGHLHRPLGQRHPDQLQRHQ